MLIRVKFWVRGRNQTAYNKQVSSQDSSLRGRLPCGEIFAKIYIEIKFSKIFKKFLEIFLRLIEKFSKLI